MKLKKPRYIDANLSESNRALLSAWIDKREVRLVIREWRTAEEISAYRAMASRRRFRYEIDAHREQQSRYWQQMAQQQSLAGVAIAQQQNAISQYSQGFGLGLLGESFFKKH